jgi:hypothetical protein
MRASTSKEASMRDSVYMLSNACRHQACCGRPHCMLLVNCMPVNSVLCSTFASSSARTPAVSTANMPQSTSLVGTFFLTSSLSALQQHSVHIYSSSTAAICLSLCMYVCVWRHLSTNRHVLLQSPLTHVLRFLPMQSSALVYIYCW